MSAIINGQSIKALVDTGAVVSVIDEHFLKEIHQGHLPPLQKNSSGDVKTVRGEPLPVSERFTTTIEIANGLYSCTFLVVRNLTYIALMGRDFLQAKGAVINLKDSTLKLEESTARRHSEEACPVRVLSNCIHAASSEVIIPAYLDQTSAPEDVGFIEASGHLIERYQLQGVAALDIISADHIIPSMLVNPTRKIVTLYRGATLGTFSPKDEDLKVFSLSARPSTRKEPQSATNVPVEPLPMTDPQSATDVPVDLTDADLTDSQKVDLQRLINEYRDMFALSPQELGRTNLVQHK